jgi:hypothetical protein
MLFKKASISLLIVAPGTKNKSYPSKSPLKLLIVLEATKCLATTLGLPDTGTLPKLTEEPALVLNACNTPGSLKNP